MSGTASTRTAPCARSMAATAWQGRNISRKPSRLWRTPSTIWAAPVVTTTSSCLARATRPIPLWTSLPTTPSSRLTSCCTTTWVWAKANSPERATRPICPATNTKTNLRLSSSAVCGTMRASIFSAPALVWRAAPSSVLRPIRCWVPGVFSLRYPPAGLSLKKTLCRTSPGWTS